MGAGKSTVGRLAAKALGAPFADTDALIEARVGPIVRFFAESGEDAFRTLEREVCLRELGAALSSAAVVSLGGGAVTVADVRAALRATPHVAWLTAPAGDLWERTRRGDASGRPLARDEADFRRLLAERELLYREVATIEVRCGSTRPLAEVVDEVVSLVLAGSGSASRPTVPGG